MGWRTPISTASHHCATWGVAWLGRDALGRTRGRQEGLDATCQCPGKEQLESRPLLS